MVEFAYPWAFVLIILPIIVYFYSSEYKEQKASIQVPYFQRVLNVTGKAPSEGAVLLKRRLIQRILLVIGWVALVTAVAKPEWVGEPIEQKKSAREIMVALDLSNSMSEEDFVDDEGNKVNRLVAAKQVLTDFAEQRKHDRLGLILFADEPYLQAPFTEDIRTWSALLNAVELGYAGYQTAFGDAIGLSIAIFEQEQSKQRVLILLTDGSDTHSKMPPIKAAEIAAKHDIKIYTIAMGDPSSKGIYKMDIATVEKVAKITGGESFQALNKTELLKAYDTIDSIEEQQYETLSFRPRDSIHHWAFAVYFSANLLLVLMLLLGRLGKKGLNKLSLEQGLNDAEQESLDGK
ncbi:VWA domain-containing protein [Colwellia psychrerythraea]|uniref:von Willebrand factor type A n=1 Tax=Colwellia psychrerythraea TaxID=28229 RepID=A0A099KTR1_COLPS|nr:VWA domain-containing protein [Colwellia psychrerythraea]KGJ94129.1 von Willebrand factor type A [Colwellia psychrerythraea]